MHTIDSSVAGVNEFFGRVFTKMAGAVALSTVIALVIGYGAVTGQPWGIALVHFGVIAMIITLLLCLGLSRAVKSAMEDQRALSIGWLYTFAGLMGVGFSSFVVAYSPSALVFGFTAATVYFVILAAFGKNTTKDLSGIGRQCYAALIALVIVELLMIAAGFFVHIPMFINTIANVISLIVFTGLTAYDTQSAKEMYLKADSTAEVGTIEVLVALNLFIDFFNLLTTLIELFGGNNRN